MISLTPRRGTSARIATQSGSASGAMVGDFQPRRDRRGFVHYRARAVVVEHQILLPEHHTLNPRNQLIARRFGRALAVGIGALDQHRLRITQRLTEGHEIVQAQGAAGSHHVGDGVGHPELHRNLHGTVEPDDGGFNPSLCQIFPHQIRVGRGDPLAGQIGRRPVTPGGPRVTEAGRPETQRQAFTHRRIRIEHEVSSGDAEIELSRTDIDGNVFGPQEEKLDLVDVVDDGEVFGIGTPSVARLREDLAGRLTQCAFVGNRDSQHAHSFR